MYISFKSVRLLLRKLRNSYAFQKSLSNNVVNETVFESSDVFSIPL